jgi:predicted lactoylglutathione lyase
MVKQIFANLAVKDLNKSVEFFKALGFSFNPQFTDDKAAALIIGENIFSMLITEKFFSQFTKKPVSDAKKSTESILALQVESRNEVDSIMAKALKAGGKEYRDKDESDWMYTRAVEDPDGHQWEFFWMDPSKAPQMQK